MTEDLKRTLDAVASMAWLSTLFGYLPQIAALLSVIWYGVRLYDRFKRKA